MVAAGFSLPRKTQAEAYATMLFRVPSGIASPATHRDASSPIRTFTVGPGIAPDLPYPVGTDSVWLAGLACG